MGTPENPRPGPTFVPIPWETLRIPQNQLSFAAKCLYGRLRLYAGLPAIPNAHERQGDCYPQEGTLADELGVSRERISEVKRELAERGLIAWKRTGRSNRYAVFPPSNFRPVDRNQCSLRPDRNNGSPQGERKAPIRSHERFRSDRSECADKKNNKTLPNRSVVKDESAAAPAVSFGDDGFYFSGEPDYG
jgi:hypothetical protein